MKRLFISLTLAMLSITILTACTEEDEKDSSGSADNNGPTIENDTITMLTSAKEVNFEIITISEGDSITVDWGDGKVQGMKSIKEHDYDTVYYFIAEFGHTYSDQKEHIIKIKTNQKVAELTCRRSGLISLNTGRCTSLTLLDCQENLLTTLNIGESVNLNYFDCYNNPLTALDVSKCTKLNLLSCRKNKLTSLDVSKCVNLTHLWFYDNQLTTIDVSKCTQLNLLDFSKNLLTSLDISKCPNLKILTCYDNKFTESEMNRIYNTLPSRSNADDATIMISSPYGDYSIIENKGWKVNKHEE